jgi:hypothetical protein
MSPALRITELGSGTTTRGRTHTSQKDVKGEGLREIVIGPKIQSANNVGRSVACRQHQHRSPIAVQTKPSRELEAIRAWQHPRNCSLIVWASEDEQRHAVTSILKRMVIFMQQNADA